MPAVVRGGPVGHRRGGAAVRQHPRQRSQRTRGRDRESVGAQAGVVEVEARERAVGPQRRTQCDRARRPDGRAAQVEPRLIEHHTVQRLGQCRGAGHGQPSVFLSPPAFTWP
eukprot:3393000-Prymnesium_polylepis.2